MTTYFKHNKMMSGSHSELDKKTPVTQEQQSSLEQVQTNENYSSGEQDSNGNPGVSVFILPYFGGITFWRGSFFCWLLLLGSATSIVAQTTTTITSTKATTNYKGQTTRNYGNDINACLESYPNYNCNSFIEFDLSSIPSGVTITNATLRLVNSDAASCDNSIASGSSFSVLVRRVTRYWEEGTTCNANQSGSLTWVSAGPTNWTTAGGDFDATDYGSFTGGAPDAEGVVYTIGVTTLVNYWYNGTYPNYGFGLVAPNGGNNWFQIYTDDAANADNRPQLLVTYTALPILSTVITNTACGSSNGAINLTVTGGTAPYTYNWGGGVTTEDRTGLAAGTYTVTVTDNIGGIATASVSVGATPTITNGMNATDLLGQYTTTAGFTNNYTQATANNNNGSVYALGFSTPRKVLIDVVDHRMFVADFTNNRVVVYNLNASNVLVDKTPDFVLGQSSFTTSTAATTQAGLNGPNDLAYDGQNKRLFVIETNNNRVTVFDVATITNGEAAINVLGQANFTTNTSATTQAGLNFPTGIAYDAANQRLFVADQINNRVTVFDVATITNGEAAINVLGQANFTTNTAATTQARLNIPNTLAYDPTNQRLFVSDYSNNRVLVFDVASITNGETAINVLGQANFTTGSAATTQSRMSNPFGVAYANDVLFVADATNNRILTFDVTAITDGEPAINVLGQSNFTTGTAATTQAGLSGPRRPDYDVTTGRLYVPDATNNRVVIFNLACPLSATGTVTNATCGSNGAIDITASGGNSPYTYNWGGGITTEDRTGLTAGAYTVTVTDAYGNTATTSATITQLSTPIVITPTVTQPTCFAGGSISLSVSGGNSPYTYDWADISGMSNPQNRVGLAAGTYTMTVTAANGCTVASGNLVLNTASGCMGTLVCRSETARVFSVDPDPTVVTYTWTVPAGAVITAGQGTPSITVNFTGTAPGAYTVCVTAQNDCGTSSQTCQNIDVNSATATATANPVCTGGNLSLFASGGGTYSWSGPSGFTSSSQNPVRYGAVAAHAGTYTVTVTTSAGCTATASVVVAIKTPPSLATAATNAACGSSNGAINLTVSGGTSPFSYLWSNSSATEDISGVAAGSYLVTVTDNNGCSATTTSSVGNTGGPSVSATPVVVTCNGGSNGSVGISVSGGTSPYTYLWSNGTTTQNVSGLTAGTYAVIVTDATGCQGVTSATVTQPNALQLDATQVNIACNGSATGSISLLVSGGTSPYSYSWSGPTAIGNTATPTNLLAGTYNVTVTAAGSCTATHSVVLTQPAALTASASPTAVSCNGGANGNVNLTAPGGTAPYTYAWSRSGGGFSATTQDITSLTAGTYTVTVTDARSCTTTASAVVSQPAAITFTNTKVDVACNGASTGSINLTPAGGTPAYTFLWSNGATTEDIASLAAGTYTVTATDTRGCTGSTSITITQATALAISVSKTDVTCNGASTGSINLTVNGGTSPYTYNWGGGVTSQNRTNLAAGNYTVTVTGTGGCTATALVSIAQNTIITIAGTATNATCNGSSTGAITLNVNGGAGGYTYAWSGAGAGTNPRTGLAAGSYTVTVTDVSLCTRTANFTVTQPTALSASGVTTVVTCNGGSNGSVNLTVSGGTSPYTFAWSSGAATEDVSGLAVGSYTVTVTDFNRCTVTQNFTINQPALLTVSGMVTPNCPASSNGSVSLTVSGGTAPFTYAWSGAGVGTSTRTGLAAGTYNVTVTDNSGCTATNSFTLDPLSLSVTGFGKTCTAQDGQAYATVSGGLEPYTFAWSNGATTEYIQGLNIGTYTVTVTAGACSLTGQYTVGQPASCLPPVAKDDHYTTKANTPISGTVMPNDPFDPGFDSDPVYPPDTLIFENLEVLKDTIGTIDWNEDGSFTYTPALNFTGSFSIDYEICNPLGLCAQATLYMDVPLTPILAVDDNGGPVMGLPGATAVLDVFHNDLLDGSPVGPLDVVLTEIIPDPTSVLTLNPDGTVDVAPNSATSIYYLTYEICEAINLTNCDTALVTVNVINLEDCTNGLDEDGDGLVDCEDPDCQGTTMPQAVADTFTTCPGMGKYSNLVSINDGNLQSPIFTIVAQPAKGTMTLNNFGAFTYTPADSQCGSISFTYQVCNQANVCCSTTEAVINFGDSEPPVLQNVPADLTISCDDEVPQPPAVVATDLCPYISIAVEDSDDLDSTSACGTYTITRTWTAKDICGNSASQSQHITVEDQAAPEVFRVYTLPNGKKMLAGNAQRTSGLWKYVKFPVHFDTPPLVFAQVASSNDAAPVTVQTRYISTTGFEMRLREEEAADQLHGGETVSWMATEPGNVDGSYKMATQLLNGVNQNFQNLAYPLSFPANPVFIASVNGMAQADPVTVRTKQETASGIKISLQEEQSADAETAHANEKLAWLTLSAGSNIYDENGNFVAESGTISTDHNWATVSLMHSFTKPVVLLGGLSSNGNQAATIRVRNVTATSFEVRVQEWDYLNDIHTNESINYLVVEGSIPTYKEYYCFNDDAPLKLGVDVIAVDNCDGQVAFDYTEVEERLSQGLKAIRTWSASDDCGNIDVLTRRDTCAVAAVKLKTLLSGAMPLTGGTGLMNDALRTKQLVPIKEPYSGLSGFQHQGMGGNETASPNFIGVEGEKAVEDWLFVECRAPGNDMAVLSTCSVLLRRDGSTTTANGDSILYFWDLPEGDYYIAARHRNHLGLMTDGVWYLSSDGPPLVDLTDPETAVRGGALAGKFANGKRAMWAGDYNGDGRAIFQGPYNDVFFLFSKVLGDPANSEKLANYISNGYNREDFDLDGRTIYQGPGNDKAMLLYHSVLAHQGNTVNLANYIVMQWLP
ncbi:MAG: DNRLRE domain-containing protein [Saprospiraceae bacterium]|nr:DNRLRE domain-containing protein [Saprospiraceae bacterium]